jgi:hypothetical protein
MTVSSSDCGFSTRESEKQAQPAVKSTTQRRQAIFRQVILFLNKKVIIFPPSKKSLMHDTR